MNISLLPLLRSWARSAQKRTAGGQNKLVNAIITRRKQELEFLCTLSVPCPMSDVKFQRVTL
jgi:hypothetical protein